MASSQTPISEPASAIQRVCFCLQVKRERLAEYRARHQQVWPDMLDGLRQAGWRNYSLFLRPDGMLIGYLETTDFTRALQAMAASEVNARWQREMADFFEGIPGEAPDKQISPLPEIFHLE